MPGLKDFIEAMSSSWPVALAILIGSILVLIGEALGLSYLQTLPDLIFGIAFLMAAFSGAVLAVAMIVKAIEIRASKQAAAQRAEKRTRHIEGLEQLPPEEKQVLSYLAAKRTQVFVAEMNHVRLEPLIAKNYVQVVPGMHSMLEWPHKVPDHIWNELILMIPEEPDKRRLQTPFGRPW